MSALAGYELECTVHFIEAEEEPAANEGLIAMRGNAASHPSSIRQDARALIIMVEKNPWWKNVSGPFPDWKGPLGCKEDGGGCHRGQGLVGTMTMHRAVNNHDKEG